VVTWLSSLPSFLVVHLASPLCLRLFLLLCLFSSAFDASWLGRGFNVVAFDPFSSAVTATATFDFYASADQSHAMLAFLTGKRSLLC
jgi:hypothetical protein